MKSKITMKICNQQNVEHLEDVLPKYVPEKSKHFLFNESFYYANKIKVLLLRMGITSILSAFICALTLCSGKNIFGDSFSLSLIGVFISFFLFLHFAFDAVFSFGANANIARYDRCYILNGDMIYRTLGVSKDNDLIFMNYDLTHSEISKIKKHPDGLLLKGTFLCSSFRAEDNKRVNVQTVQTVFIPKCFSDFTEIEQYLCFKNREVTFLNTPSTFEEYCHQESFCREFEKTASLEYVNNRPFFLAKRIALLFMVFSFIAVFIFGIFL